MAKEESKPTRVDWKKRAEDAEAELAICEGLLKDEQGKSQRLQEGFQKLHIEGSQVKGALLNMAIERYVFVYAPGTATPTTTPN